jgi:hypothetical protein
MSIESSYIQTTQQTGSTEPVEPTVEPVEPTAGTVDQTVQTVDQTVGTVEPTVGTVEPTVGTVEPTVGTVEPTVGTVGQTVPTVDQTVPTVDQTVPTVDQTVPTVDQTVQTVPTVPTVEPTEHKEHKEHHTDPTKVFTWNGKRPFAGTIPIYKKTLNDAIEQAKQHFATHPEHKFAHVKLPLFTTICVELTNQCGETRTKKYAFHEAHYAPLLKSPVPHGVSLAVHRLMNFDRRLNYIWVLLNDGTKLAGGDGTGKGGTACSPFRDTQMELLKDGYYLVDESELVGDPMTGRLRYNINIRLYKTPPPNGPFRSFHGYGFIPNLGSVATHQQVFTRRQTLPYVDVQMPADQSHPYQQYQPQPYMQYQRFRPMYGRPSLRGNL